MSGDRLCKRTVRVPMCFLRVANTGCRKVLHGLRTNRSEPKLTASELDESIARPRSRHQSEIELVGEKDLLEKSIVDNATISRLINEQKYMAEQTLCLAEANEKLQRELKMAYETVLDLAETNEMLVKRIRRVEIKCLERGVQLKNFGVPATASTAAFAGKTAAATKSIKVTVAAVARPAAAASSAVNRTAPLKSILKTRTVDRSQKRPESVSDLRLQVNNNHTRAKRETDTRKSPVAAKKVVRWKDETREIAKKRDRNVPKPERYDPCRTRQPNEAGDVTKVVWKPRRKVVYDLKLRLRRKVVLRPSMSCKKPRKERTTATENNGLGVFIGGS